MIITYTFTMARWQIVAKSQTTKQTKDQNNNKQVIATEALDDLVDGFHPSVFREKTTTKTTNKLLLLKLSMAHTDDTMSLLVVFFLSFAGTKRKIQKTQEVISTEAVDGTH